MVWLMMLFLFVTQTSGSAAELDGKWRSSGHESETEVRNTAQMFHFLSPEKDYKVSTDQKCEDAVNLLHPPTYPLWIKI